MADQDKLTGRTHGSDTVYYVECVQSSGRVNVLFWSQATGGASMRGELDIAPFRSSGGMSITPCPNYAHPASRELRNVFFVGL